MKASMKIELSYGKSVLGVTLPRGARPTIIRKPSFPVPPSPQALIESALAAPIGCAGLDELARGSKSACILICDITRPVPNALVLRPLIEGLMAAGMDRERITVLVDTSVAEQQYIEDCQVCCRPMTLLVTSLDDREVSISVHNDLD